MPIDTQKLLRQVLLSSVIALLYAFSAKLSMALAIPPGNVTSVFLASGVGLSAGILYGKKALLGIWFGSFLGNAFLFNITDNVPQQMVIAMVIAIGATLEALTIMQILQMYGITKKPFNNTKHLFVFTLSSLACCTISATIGTGIIYFQGLLPIDIYTESWITWWLGDTLGIILITPLIIILRKNFFKIWRKNKMYFVESLFLICLIFLFGWFSSNSKYPIFYLFIPFLLWAALRFQQSGIVLANLLVSALVVRSALNHTAFFVNLSYSEALLLLQGYIGVVSITSLFLATLVRTQKEAEDNLQKANQELEERVKLRTAKLHQQTHDLLEKNREIKTQQVKLENLNQIKDRLFSIISHDLRSPLNTLQGFLSLLNTGDNFLNTHEGELILDNTKERLTVSLDLLDNLLFWASSQMDSLRVDKTEFIFFQIVEENFKLFQVIATQKNIVLSNLVNPDLLIKADLNMIKMICRNLISNAIKFTPKGGQVELSTIEHTDFIQVCISDTGIGIAPEKQKMIFNLDTRHSTKGTEQESGTGVGLILCKEFIEDHHGKIWFESEEGKGTTFFFTLPK